MNNESRPAHAARAEGALVQALLGDERDVVAFGPGWALSGGGAGRESALVGRGCRMIAEVAAGSRPEAVRRALDEVAKNAATGCAAGFISYDCRNAFEPAVDLSCKPQFPLLRFCRVQEWKREESAAGPWSAEKTIQFGGRLEEYGELGGVEYADRVRKIQEEIGAGEYYELNFTQRFRVRSQAPPGLVALRLYATAGAPYWAYLRWEDRAVISASPELFLRRDGDRVWTKPIKGSARRGRSVEEDQAQQEILRQDEKNSAEHTMVVDLARNDLGRVCRYGTVETLSRATVESYPSVHHLVSTVTGLLRERTEAGDLLEATFPAASITGCPKVRVMRAIDAHEISPRGLYTGSIGWIGSGGKLELNVAIRTLTARLAEENVWEYEFGAGGAVVADSVPADEYRECLLKGRPLLEAIRWAESRG